MTRHLPPQKATYSIISWNVAGLRGLLRRHPQALQQLVAKQRPDVLCLQETRLQQKDVADMVATLAPLGYHASWCCSTARLGHAGVVTLSKETPQRVRAGLRGGAFLADGRTLTSRFADFTLVNVYVPNSGDGLKNLEARLTAWDPALATHAGRLAKMRPVVVAGDFNVAPAPLDVYDPRRLVRYAGFTPQERKSFVARWLDAGWVDAFRQQHPDRQAFTFYSWRGGMRAKGRGWRLDHFMLSAELAADVAECSILPDASGADHLPIKLVLNVRVRQGIRHRVAHPAVQ